MATVARYITGQPCLVNPAGGNGVRISAMSPAGQLATLVTTNGTQADTVINGAVSDVITQRTASDGGQCFTDVDHSTAETAYNGTYQADPGLTSSPIDFAAGVEGCVLKSAFETEQSPINTAQPIEAIEVLTVAAAAPALGSFRPGIMSASKAPPFNESDLIDLSTLPTKALLTGHPNPETVFRRLRYLQSTPYANGGDPAQTHFPQRSYPVGVYPVRDIAQGVSDAILLLCSDIPVAMKRKLAICVCQIGIDAAAFIEANDPTWSGRDYGGEDGATGLGGVVQHNYALAVLAASILFGGDTGLRTTGQKPHFDVDGQFGYVTQAMIDGTQAPGNTGGGVEQYIQGDLDMPEYSQGNLLLSSTGSNAHILDAYRWIVGPYAVEAALAIHVLPGLAAIWNRQAFLDYADRIMERDFYNPAIVGESRTTENKPQRNRIDTGTNSIRGWAVAMWDAHRADGAALWDWA